MTTDVLDKTPDLDPANLPFAVKLSYCLGRKGVKTQFWQSVDGGKIGGVVGVHQLVSYTDYPEPLAELIIAKCGENVDFFEFALPRMSMYSAFQQYKDVWVRHIVDYKIMTDTYVQCWDVLVRRATAAAIPLQGELK